MDLVELVMEMEDEFGINIPDADATELTTVGKTADYIVAQLRARNVGRNSVDESAVFERVRTIVAEQLALPVESITRDSRYVEDLHAS